MHLVSHPEVELAAALVDHHEPWLTVGVEELAPIAEEDARRQRLAVDANAQPRLSACLAERLAGLPYLSVSDARSNPCVHDLDIMTAVVAIGDRGDRHAIAADAEHTVGRRHHPLACVFGQPPSAASRDAFRRLEALAHRPPGRVQPLRDL